MKFKKFLNEKDIGSEDINDLIHKDCKPYLKLLKSLDEMPLVRAMNGMAFLEKLKVNKNREPLGTKPAIFKKLNTGLQRNGHNRRDKSICCTSHASSDRTQIFGYPYFIFPIGDFSYTWVDSKDINENDIRTGFHRFALEEYFKNPETFDADYKMKMSKPFKEYFHTDKDIQKAINEGYEIGIDCNEYYIVDVNGGIWNRKSQVLIHVGD